jgi:hypothetical protein
MTEAMAASMLLSAPLYSTPVAHGMQVRALRRTAGRHVAGHDCVHAAIAVCLKGEAEHSRYPMDPYLALPLS